MFTVPESFHELPRYLGYRDADFALPFAKYFKPRSAPVLPHIVPAIVSGGMPAELVPPLKQFGEYIVEQGYQPIETGWCVLSDGTIFASVHTPMPRVTAAMWDWWFAWHSAQSQRYKLWCPESHYVACWADDRGDEPLKTGSKSYIGRTSLINEYIGSQVLQGSVRFIPPTDLGIDVSRFEGTIICARIGGVMAPIEFGWLMHQVRNIHDGAEMRSRFYIGGDVGVRAPIPGPVAATIAREGGTSPFTDAEKMAQRLVYHCGLEMNNLAQFLPELYSEFGPNKRS